MDEVMIGAEGRWLRLSNNVAAPADDPYAGGSFHASLTAAGLSATRRVFVYGFTALDQFFAQIAEDWTGWAGIRSWDSPEHDLSIAATSAGARQVELSVTVRDGPQSTWSATIATAFDAGEDARRIARAVSSFFASDS